jgi:ribonuclease HI
MQNFQQQMEKYQEHEQTYTDGSKSEEGVGCSAISWSRKSLQRLPDQTSVYTAEATAIEDAGQEHLDEWEKRLILTDSLSTIQAVKNNNKNPIIQRIIRRLHDSGGRIQLKWIPGHSGIEGNEIADQEAKKATTRSALTTILTAEDAVAHVKRMSNNKIKPHIPKDISRRQQVALARWRMGYTRETHKYLVEKTLPPICDTCNLPKTCQHILLHCSEYNMARLATGLTENYRNGEEIETIRLLRYLDETGFTDKG